MNKTPKLWEILAAFIPVISAVIVWVWNLSTTVNNNKKDIEYLRTDYKEYKQDIKEIKESQQTILLKLENKLDRDKK
jgi:hypothetical protein